MKINEGKNYPKVTNVEEVKYKKHVHSLVLVSKIKKGREKTHKIVNQKPTLKVRRKGINLCIFGNEWSLQN